MPTKNPGINVVFENPLYERVKLLANREDISLSTKVRGILRRKETDMQCISDVSIRGLLAGGCLFGILLASSPSFCLDNATVPTAQTSPVEAGLAPLPDPLLMPPPVEGKHVRPSDPFLAREKVKEALQKADFSYNETKLVDPFVSFIAPVQAPPPRLPLPLSEEDLEPPPEPKRALTPLQKMNLGEIEKGLKAIVWGEFGRKAMVEDSAGKGYIVGVGTPVGEKEGVITDVFNDSLVIQQQVWDSRLKRMMPQNFVVKLKKQPPPK